MNVRTNLHAGQNDTVDVDKLTELVKELDCQISPLEMIGLAKKYCNNIDANSIAEILQLIGAGNGTAQFLSIFGR